MSHFQQAFSLLSGRETLISFLLSKTFTSSSSGVTTGRHPWVSVTLGSVPHSGQCCPCLGQLSATHTSLGLVMALPLVPLFLLQSVLASESACCLHSVSSGVSCGMETVSLSPGSSCSHCKINNTPGPRFLLFVLALFM